MAWPIDRVCVPLLAHVYRRRRFVDLYYILRPPSPSLFRYLKACIPPSRPQLDLLLFIKWTTYIFHTIVTLILLQPHFPVLGIL